MGSQQRGDGWLIRYNLYFPRASGKVSIMVLKLPEIIMSADADQYAVMGNPITHSLSPQIHQQFAEQTDQNLIYQAIEAPLDQFAAMVEKFRSAGGRGLNITVPFKQQAWELAEQRSEFAERAGAVNTLWFDEQSRIIGDNTDGRGMIRDILVNLQQGIKDKRVLMLGAGGAVRGVIEPLFKEQPRSCVIANRTMSRAEQLAKLFADLGEIMATEYSELEGVQFDLIINGTSASLQGELPPLAGNILADGGVCYDMMYSKTPTEFVKWGRDQGAILSVDGLGMLIEQAAESFLLWRGVRPLTESVIKAFRT